MYIYQAFIWLKFFGSLSLLNIEANVQKYMLIVIYKDEWSRVSNDIALFYN